MTENETTKIDSTIRSSLEYYDRNCEKYNDFLKNIKYIKYIDNNQQTDEIIFYDKNKNILLQSPFEILGLYLPNKHLWKWSWSMPTFPKKRTLLSRKILDYAFNLNNEDDYLLKSKLINSKINIYNDLQLDIHIAVSSYLGKQPLIYKFYNVFEEDDNYNDSDYEYMPVFNKQNVDKDYMIMYLFIINHEDIKL